MLGKGKSRTHGPSKSSKGAGGHGTKGGKNIHPKGGRGGRK